MNLDGTRHSYPPVTHLTTFLPARHTSHDVSTSVRKPLAECRSPLSPLLIPPLRFSVRASAGVLTSVPVALVIKRAGYTHTHTQLTIIQRYSIYVIGFRICSVLKLLGLSSDPLRLHLWNTSTPRLQSGVNGRQDQHSAPPPHPLVQHLSVSHHSGTCPRPPGICCPLPLFS